MSRISEHKPPPKLWLAVRLPLLPLHALGFLGDEAEPCVVIETQKVICVNDNAYTEGARIGMDMTTATLMSGAECLLRDVKCEVQTLKELSQRMYEFTPYIEIYFPKQIAQGGVLLEIASSLRLFNGLDALILLIKQSLIKTSFPFTLGLAHTTGAAWLLSHHPDQTTFVDDVNFFIDQLNTLPIQLLHEFPDAVESLEKTGFITLADITRQVEAQSISTIKKRLGKEFAKAIADIFGIEHDFEQAALFDKPAEVFIPEEKFIETVELEYPTSNTEFLKWPIEVLLERLTNFLRKRQLECQRIEWTLSDIHRQKELMSVYCDSSQSHWELWFKLTMIQIEARELPFEVDTVTLECPHTLPIQRRNNLLVFDDGKKQISGPDLTLTLAKLSALLGEASITKLSYQDSFLPEECSVEIHFNQQSNQQIPAIYRKILKPAWMFPLPAPIEIRSSRLYWKGYLELLNSPRRVRAGWRKQPVARDYYLAKRHDGSRLWVFKDNNTKQWYVQGVFL
jgi:protein ImuB